MDKKFKYLFGRGIGKSLWMAALVLLTVQGCVTIDDNTDDCFPLARLRFEYTHNYPLPGYDKFRDQVESIDLYAYRQSDSSLVATQRYTQADLIRSNYSVDLRWLRQDDYYIVAFGNKHDTYYSCRSYERMTDLRLGMICSDGQGTITTNPCHFFYGFLKLAKTETDEKIVSMIKDTNDIIVTIRNKVTTRADGVGLPDLKIDVALRNGTLKHDNNIADDDMRLMTHISNSSFEEYATSLESTLRVGRLFGTDGSVITITNSETGNVLSTENLTQKIIELYTESDDYDDTLDANEYLDRQDTYNLVYDLEMKYGVLITTLVTINDWNAVENPIGGV